MALLDIIDKSILLALDRNCRLSYQSLAESLGISATAIRKRFDRLNETGVIDAFTVVLKPAMIGTDELISLVYTDGSENESVFTELIGGNLNVAQVGQIVTAIGRLYFIYCEYVGAEGLQQLATLFRKQKSVTNLELHTVLISRGKEFKIKKVHLQVLKHLMEDARMPVNLLSERVGFTARRVSRAIQEMQDSDAFWFTTRWNLSLGNSSEFYLKIVYDEQVTTKEGVDEWLRKTYPLEYWYSYNSAMEPMMFAKFVTEHFREAELISSTVKNAPFTKCVDILLSYPVRKFPRLGRIRIEELISDTLDSS